MRLPLQMLRRSKSKIRHRLLEARGKLEVCESARRVDPTPRPLLAHGRITAIDADAASGRIEADDGHVVCFHRRCLAGARFEELKTALEVRFAEEAGHNGPQASIVHVIS